MRRARASVDNGVSILVSLLKFHCDEGAKVVISEAGIGKSRAEVLDDERPRLLAYFRVCVHGRPERIHITRIYSGPLLRQRSGRRCDPRGILGAFGQIHVVATRAEQTSTPSCRLLRWDLSHSARRVLLD